MSRYLSLEQSITVFAKYRGVPGHLIQCHVENLQQ